LIAAEVLDKLKSPLSEDERYLPLPDFIKTDEEAFYWRLKHDVVWYAENFLMIRNKKSQLVPLKYNTAQLIMERIDRYCIKHGLMRRYIVLKARQMGLSTYTESKIFHETANNKLTRSLIIAHEEKASSNLFNMSKLFYEELPDILRPMKKYSNGKILSFENPTNEEKDKKINPGLRSDITIATAGTGEVGRSATPTKIHASEVAFFPDAQVTMLGLMQGVPDEPETLVVLESTANGIGDWFHRQWQRATKGESDFIPIFLPWFIDPSYIKEFTSPAEKKMFAEQVNAARFDSEGNRTYTYEYQLMKKFNLSYEQLKWRRWAIANKCQGDETLFRQEYPSTAEEAFISTGRPVFSTDVLKEYQTITRHGEKGYFLSDDKGGVTWTPDPDGYVELWDKPEKYKRYCVGVDVAEGLAQGDYSVGVVMDEKTCDIVAMWHGHIDPDLLAHEMIKVCRYYNDAYLGVESNNHGGTTLLSLKRLEYWNLFFQKTYDKISNQISKKLGWNTNTNTKRLMIDKLNEFVREKWIGIYSDLIISEMLTYIRNDKGQFGAQEGCFDDTVMAAAIALQLVLEGQGEDYVPEIPIDQRKGYKPEVIDPLFEGRREEEKVEISL